MSLQEFINKNTGLSTAKTKDLKTELEKRQAVENIFPLEIFHPALKPMLEAMVTKFDLDKGFIGLTLMSALSTAIGTAFAVTTKTQPKRNDFIYLGIWACNVGISSSGKSFVINRLYAPHYKIQSEFDYEWTQKTTGKSDFDINKETNHTLLYMDTHVATLVRSTLPDNPKGVCKIADELAEWINGMDPNAKGGKEGTDQQFWLKVWNSSPVMVMRSGKQKTSLPRPFVNVIGGTQHELMPRFFAKDRDVTGFIFRLLFAIDDRNTAADIDPYFDMPEEWEAPYTNAINTIYQKFTVDTTEDEPRACILSREAIGVFYDWVKRNQKKIDQIEDVSQRSMQHGIFGKIKEHAWRFSAVLFVADKVLDKPNYIQLHEINLSHSNSVTSEYMERAIMACEYFFKSATIAYERVQKQRYAPPEAIITANMMRGNKSAQSIADVVFQGKSATPDGRRQKLNRALKKWYIDYYWLFGTAK
jgi:hypothetical protein